MLRIFFDKFIRPILRYFFSFFTRLFAPRKKQHYTLSVGKKGATRLTLLNDLVNPHSIEFINQVVSLKNKRILEVGCGLGIMAARLAVECLPDGYVLATDISNEQLELAKLIAKNSNAKNIQYQQISAINIHELNQKFDVIYFRFVLGHLPEALEILQKTTHLMHTESILICEEIENVDVMYCDPPQKAFDWWQDALRMQINACEGDFTIGKNLIEMIHQINLVVDKTKCAQPIMISSEIKQQLWLGIVEISPILLSTGFASQTEIDSMIKDLKKLAKSPLTKIGFFSMRQIAAKKPGNYRKTESLLMKSI